MVKDRWGVPIDHKGAASLKEVVLSDPDRFARYIEKTGVKTLEDFMRKTKEAFSKDYRGVNLLSGGIASDSEMLTALLGTDRFKSLQESETEIKAAAEKQRKREHKKALADMRKIERELKDLKKITSRTRTGKVYRRSYQEWNISQARWLYQRRNYRDNAQLAAEFNSFFKVKRTASSIKTKKLRLRKFEEFEDYD